MCSLMDLILKYETLPAYFSKAFQKYKWLDNDLGHLSMLGKIFAQIQFQGLS